MIVPLEICVRFGSFHNGLGQVIEQYMGFPVEHAVALLNGSLSDRLSQVTLSSSTGTEKLLRANRNGQSKE
jgi:hypothetical protein